MQIALMSQSLILDQEDVWETDCDVQYVFFYSQLLHESFQSQFMGYLPLSVQLPEDHLSVLSSCDHCGAQIIHPHGGDSTWTMGEHS